MKNKVLKLLAVVSSMAITSCNTASSSSTSLLPSTSESSVEESSSSEETSSTSSESSEEISTSSSESSSSSSSEEVKPNLDALDGTPMSKDYISRGYTPLFKDLNHKHGYIVSKTTYGPGESPHYDYDYLKLYEDDYKKPAWTIAQWNSRFDLKGTDALSGYTHDKDSTGLVHTITSKGNGVKPGKKMIINSQNGEIYLEANCGVEYLKDRTGTEPWVHLLLSQDFGNDLRFVSKLSSLYLDASYTIHSCEDKTYGVVNPNAHAAQLVYFVTIQNRNMASKDYGKYIWFGMPLWDNRNAGGKAGSYIAHDAGTDTLIYAPGSTYYFHDSSGLLPKVGERARARADILPIVKTAFAEAKQKGYLGTTTWEELAIGGMNFGYEVPGTYDISATVHDIGVYYK
jgi:hypothetical protein